MPLDGARQGAPEAIRVADRFHLWQNLAEAVEKTVIAHHAALCTPEPVAAQVRTEPAAGPVSPQAAGPATSPEPDGFRDVCGRERRLVARHRERYSAVQALLTEGVAVREIGRRLGAGPQDLSQRRGAWVSLSLAVIASALAVTTRASLIVSWQRRETPQATAGLGRTVP